MVTLKVSIPKLPQLEKAFKNAPEVAVRELGTGIRRYIMILDNAAKREAPVNKSHGGGTLRQSINHTMTGLLSGEVAANASYAGYVEEGTKPHIIESRNKKVLATSARNAPGWPIVSKGGYAIFGKRVQHPGTKANPFMQRAIDNTIDKLENELAGAAERTLKTISDSV